MKFIFAILALNIVAIPSGKAEIINQPFPKTCLGSICLGNDNFSFFKVVKLFGKGDTSKHLMFVNERCYWVKEKKLSLILGYSSDDLNHDKQLDGIFISHDKLCAVNLSKSGLSYLKNTDSSFNFLNKLRVNALKKNDIPTRQYVDKSKPRKGETIFLYEDTNKDSLLFNEIGIKKNKITSYLLNISP